MKNTGYVSKLRWVLLVVIAMGFLSCDRNNSSDTATITIKVPAEFVNSGGTGSNITAGAISGKPDNINRIIISVSGPKGELGNADILAAGGTLSFNVPAFTNLTVSGFAYAGQTLKYKGSTEVPALAPGSQNGIGLTLIAVDGTSGTIVIDAVPATSGTVSLYEVDNSGADVGPARASASVTDGQFTLNIPQAIIPSSHYVIRANINGETIESRYVSTGTIEINPLTHAVSRLVNQLAALSANGLNDISVQEILEIQHVLENIRNLYGTYDPSNEITLDQYADELIRILKNDIETSAVATSAITGNQICGRVVDANQFPLAGIRIVVRDFATFLLSATTTTGADGHYCVNVPAPQQQDPFTAFTASGDYIIGAINRSATLSAASQWWTSNGPAILRIDAGKLSFGENTQATADFTLPPGVRIQGVVQSAPVEGTGAQPLAGINVMVRDKATQFLVAGTITDAFGAFQLNVPPGDYIIEARNETSQPYASATYTANGATNNRNLGEIVSLQNNDVFTANINLYSGVALSGSVTDNGSAVTGVRVFVDNDEGGPATRLLVSKIDGGFNVWLKPDVYQVSSHGQRTTVDLSGGSQQAPLNFASLVAQLPVIMQYNGKGAGKAKARLYFDTDSGLQFADTDFSKSDGSLTLYSDSSGSSVIEARVEGAEAYASTIYSDQTQRMQGTRVTLTIGQAAPQIQVNLPQAGVLTGTVTSDGVTPSPNVQVIVRQGGVAPGNNFVSTRTRGDGTYTISLPGGIAYDAVNFNDGTNSVNCTNNVLITNGSITQLDVILNTQSQCTVSNVENSPPTANAGANQSVSVGATVALDGGLSSDPNNDSLTYAWTFTSMPAGSTASLNNASSVTPSFKADKLGDYVIQLIVNDGQVNSVASTVTITAVNDKPVANAGANQDVTVFNTVTLDGSSSNDTNGDALTYNWSFTSVPNGSQASLSDSTVVAPTFVADVVGTYVLQLIVNDGLVDSDPATVTIIASPATIRLQLLNTSLIGVGRTAQIGVTLTDPAPAGGATVTISSDNAAIVSVGGTNTVVIPQGTTNGQITVNGVAAGTTTLRANANGYVEGTLDVSVTLNLISIPTTLNVPLGQTVNLPVTIAPDPAPAGGVAVDLVSSDPATGELVTASVTIAEGTRSANATINGLKPGTLVVTASNPNYASDSSDVSVTAALNITDTSLTFNNSFPQNITIQLQSGGLNTSAPQPIIATLTAADPTCVAVTSPVTIDTGLVSTTATISYGGTAALPCSTTVTASAPNISSDTLNVTVNPPAPLTFNTSYTVGAGLQTNGYLYLGVSNHGGVTVHILSSDPAVALVSPDNKTAGTGSIDVFIANGQTGASFYVQGMEGNTGTVTFTATATGFSEGNTTVTVVQPAVSISLSASSTTLSANSPFYVYVGIPYANNAGVYPYQAVRAGGPTLTATLGSSDPTVGQLTTAIATGGSVTVDITPGQYYSPNTVANGGVEFDPLASGTTTVSATIPGYITTTASSVAVSVSAPTIVFNPNYTYTVGAGLQTNGYINLGASNHGGVTVHIQSGDSAIALVSPDNNTAGTGSIDIFVADGQAGASFYLQGVEGNTGAVTFSATATGFSEGTTTVTVVQPALSISLGASTTTLSANSPFYVYVGVPYSNNTGVYPYQAVRAGGPTLTATLVSSDPTVGQLTTAIATGGSVTVDIAPGQYSSPNTAANGGVEFDPLASGTTTVSATIPSFIATTAASVAVTVSAPTIVFNPNYTYTVGAGLQTYGYINLGTSNHGGITVHIQSGDPAIALVSPDNKTAGTGSIDVFVADGQAGASFYLQGVEGNTGAVTFSATATGFSEGTTTVTVVQPALSISLGASSTTLSPNSPFYLYVGIPYSNNAGVSPYQAVRAGGPTLTATLVSNNPTVGQLTTATAIGGNVTVDIVPGQYSSPFGAANGGVEFDPLTSGTTTISAAIPGFIATTAASVDVTVSAPTIVFNSNYTYTVGAGLQTIGYINLGASNHGGVTVHIQSSNSGVALVSPDDKTAGTGSIDVFVADGQAGTYFYLQGVEGTTGAVTFSASAPGFVDGTTTITVVQPAVSISLGVSTTASAANSPFYVYVGVPYSNNAGVSPYQAVRAGGPTLTATLVSSDPTVGQLTTATATGGSVTVDIAPGQYYSPNTAANGGVEFDPLASGTTMVSATIPNFIATTAASVNVAVTP